VRLSEDEGSAGHLQWLGAGTCALCAYIDTRDNLLYVANLGDSRAVLGKQSACMEGLIEAVEVTVDHNIKTDTERHRIRSSHPEDEDVITERWDDFEYAWLLKGRARFSRSIGDVIFKDPEQAEFYNACLSENDAHRRMMPLPKLGKPYLSNRAEVTSRRIVKGDFFLVMGCDGLWDEMSSDQVCSVVQCLIAKHGVKANLAEKLSEFVLNKVAQRLAVEEPELEISSADDLKGLPPGSEGRRELHDDITIVILIFDQRYLQLDKGAGGVKTARGGANTPLDDITPMATPRTDRSYCTDNSQVGLLAAESVASAVPTTPPREELGAAASWFGSSLSSKAPYEDVRKAVERMQPSSAETPQSRKGKLDVYYGMRSETPSPPPKGGLSPLAVSATALLGAHGSPTGTLSSDSESNHDGGDTTRTCTITELGGGSPRDPNPKHVEVLRGGLPGKARLISSSSGHSGLELNMSNQEAAQQHDDDEIGSVGVQQSYEALDTGRSYLDTGRSLASIDEQGFEGLDFPSELADFGDDFDVPGEDLDRVLEDLEANPVGVRPVSPAHAKR